MKISLEPKKRSRLPLILVTLVVLALVAVIAAWALLPSAFVRSGRWNRLMQWFGSPETLAAWQIQGGEKCEGAPMMLPTTGYIGVDYGDSFRPGHRHSGYDIFSPAGENNITPIVAAYDGYLTRESDWLSTVIIRHPDFPALVNGAQIWTYYTHMASADGTESYVSDAFPRGTYEVFVEAGTVLGYQGTWSGNTSAPTGLHLHFSVVKSAPSGGYANETDINNTYDPQPFLGVTRTADGALVCP